MPFAPITLSRFKNKMYLNCRKGSLTNKFMTITYKCKKKMECNPKGPCWCKNLTYMISKKSIEKKKKCMCEECLKEKFEHL